MGYGFRIGCALALSLALMAGCSDENGQGGSGGMAGTGGTAGTGGMAGDGGTGGMAGEGGTGGAECTAIEMIGCDVGPLESNDLGSSGSLTGFCSADECCGDFADIREIVSEEESLRVELTLSWVGDIPLALTVTDDNCEILAQSVPATNPAVLQFQAVQNQLYYAAVVTSAESATAIDYTMKTKGTPLSTEQLQVYGEPTVPIPDNYPTGTNVGFLIQESGQVISVGVSVNIEHTYPEDLVVSLTSPSETSVVLWDRDPTCCSGVLTANSRPELQKFVGEPLQGTWRLDVADVALGDEGIFWRADLTFEYVN